MHDRQYFIGGMVSGTLLLNPHIFKSDIFQLRHKERDYYV